MKTDILKFIRLIFIVGILVYLLVGCTPDPNYPIFYESMVELEEPVNENGLWFSHQLVLNDQETLLYAPKTLRYDDAIYFNEREVYILRAKRKGLFGPPFTYTEATTDQLREIFDWYFY